MHEAPIADIDHLLTYVASLDAAALSFERMGFTLTPRSEMPAMGVVNRLALFEGRNPVGGNFIELMAQLPGVPLHPAMVSTLSAPERSKVLVTSVPDVETAGPALRARGFDFGAPVSVQRDWRISDSETVTPRFRLLMAIPAPLRVSGVQFMDIGLYRRPEWLRHANTAQSLDAVLAVAEPAAEPVAWFERLFACTARQHADGSVSVSPGRTRLEFHSASGWAARQGEEPPAGPAPCVVAARFAGYRIAVADFGRLQALLRDNAVPFTLHTPRRLSVPASFAHGNLIEFVPTQRDGDT